LVSQVAHWRAFSKSGTAHAISLRPLHKRICDTRSTVLGSSGCHVDFANYFENIASTFIIQSTKLI